MCAAPPPRHWLWRHITRSGVERRSRVYHRIEWDTASPLRAETAGAVGSGATCGAWSYGTHNEMPTIGSGDLFFFVDLANYFVWRWLNGEQGVASPTCEEWDPEG